MMRTSVLRFPTSPRVGEYKSNEFNQNKHPRGHWDNIDNQRKFLDSISAQLKLKDLNDLYNLSQKQIIDLGGAGLLYKHNNNTLQLITTLYPEHKWLPWKFTNCSRKYWDDISNQRKFMDWVAEQKKITDLSDWYRVTTKEIIDIGGAGLFHKYNCSLIQLLSAIYPDYEWLPWKFTRTSTTYLQDSKAQRQLMERIAKQKNIKNMSDWYKISEKDIIDSEGGFLLVNYESKDKLLSTVFPEYQWNFADSQVSIWKNKELANYFVEWMKKNSTPKELQYLRMITSNREQQKGDILLDTLSQVSPQFKNKGSKKSQLLLKETLNLLFFGEEVLEEYKHPDLQLKTGPLELDFYYPKFNLAFEYQGQQHYREVAKYNRSESVDENKQRDLAKVNLCKSIGITLIEVPFWWDRKFSSLYATIYSHRPDLVPAPVSGKPIPLSPPTKDTTKTSTKTKVMTATEWDVSMDPSGWLMTEKFDGVRLYWDGSHFYTRHGEKVFPPKSFTNQLPAVPLDGELWTRYGLFQEAVTLCRSTNEEKWKEAKFMVFDSPSLADKPIEERIQHLNSLKDLPSFVHIVNSIKCEGKQHLQEFHSQIVAKGGEGVMLREPGSLYKVGRSSSLRKFKAYHDTEVKILINQYPHGFVCEQINGKRLFVNIMPKDQSLELKKMAPGSIITVKHLGTNVYGTLQYPQFYRQRNDVSWEKLIKN